MKIDQLFWQAVQINPHFTFRFLQVSVRLQKQNFMMYEFAQTKKMMGAVRQLHMYGWLGFCL